YEWVNADLYGHCVHGTYRKPTKQEFSQKYWDVHADGRYAYNRFSSYWRKEANRRVRRVNDREILKWMKNEDHEVILQKVEDLVDIWFYD
ncbi:MAG TPA: hypothetical protein VFM18_12110, partial [Methanosarcina sp.]|nr:hypothetical protein [Methanosarcina sp.]